MGVVTVPASADRMEHVSLLRHHLEPENSRDARVTKQHVLPVTTFLMCAALFLTACVGVLVVGARPDVPGGGRIVSISSLREAEAARNRAIDTDLIQDPRWFDQGRPLDRITVYHGAESNVAERPGRLRRRSRFRRVARRALLAALPRDSSQL